MVLKNLQIINEMIQVKNVEVEDNKNDEKTCERQR